MRKIALLMCIILLFTMTACGTSIKSEDLTKKKSPNEISVSTDLKDKNVILTDFGVRLFQESLDKDENTLISPLSVVYALAMTANGAKEDTLSEMEAVLGVPVDELNEYLYSYKNSLPQDEKYKLSLANSIWFTDDEKFTVNDEFLQINADYYGADIYKTPFDNQTLKDINNWVNLKTDEMIPEILDEIPEEAVMYLVNALAFEAEWQDVYKNTQVREGEFTLEDGSVQNVVFMNGEEYVYFEDEDTTGFLKYYKDGKYAFAAFLPAEGLSMEEYVAGLSGDKVQGLLDNVENRSVVTSIPKFETEYDIMMNDVLKSMGMEQAFEMSKADFSRLGTHEDGNICISRVLHKTFISVGEKGTKAGASTAVEMIAETAMEMDEPKCVKLDRPFVYMLIDCENNVPFFIGTTMSVNE